jgi:hypothetical protein
MVRGLSGSMGVKFILDFGIPIMFPMMFHKLFPIAPHFIPYPLPTISTIGNYITRLKERLHNLLSIWECA